MLYKEWLFGKYLVVRRLLYYDILMKDNFLCEKFSILEVK